MQQTKPRRVKQLRDGTQVVKSQATEGMRQLRCPGCGNMCKPAYNNQGKSVTKCSKCGREFGLQKM